MSLNLPIYESEQALEKLSALHAPRQALDSEVSATVSNVIAAVRDKGDTALKEFTQKFSKEVPESFLLTKSQIQQAIDSVSPEAKQVIDAAAENIRIFAEATLAAIQPVHLNRQGFEVGLDWKPVERVGCYVPGGRYPLPSTALMTAITAHVAGVPNISLTCPALKNEVIYAGSKAGVSRFYQLGGAQAVAAYALGTETIEAVDMVVGPGNAYVTEAKRQLQGIIGIDMLAGPSEVGIIADNGANPRWVALDLLAQAEHDPDASAYLFTDSVALAQAVVKEIQHCLTELSLPDFIEPSLAQNGGIFVLDSLNSCIHWMNNIAPEHLELQVANPEALKPKLNHYGALFMGYQTTVPHGDYMAGPNHTLPTARSARFSGTLNPMTFMRPQSWIQVLSETGKLSEQTAVFAGIEGLIAHQQAAEIRQ